MRGFENIPIRFFIYDEEIVNQYDDTTGNFREASEDEFLAAEGRIMYERHTVFQNGVSQICITKNPFAE